MACCTPPQDIIDASRRAEAALRLEKRLLAFDASGGYADAVLSMTDTSTRWRMKAITEVRAHLHRLESGVAGRGGILFTGPTGIGKTRAAISICRAIGQVDADGVRVVPESSLLQPGIPPWELHEHIRQMLRGGRTIFIDDVGSVARPQDQVMTAWKVVADTIAASPESTLVLLTTNYHSLNDMSGWVGSQATSRLAAYLHQATTGWVDHRTGTEHRTWRHHLEGALRQGQPR